MTQNSQKDTTPSAKRNLNLDIIRSFACFCVISVHFFYNNGFYSTNDIGSKMYIMTVMRTFFLICVPLFLCLTGYLMNQKQLCAKYYSGIRKTIILYILSSFVILAFCQFYLKQQLTLKDAFFNITGFGQYSWYINMYIGLFLLIPFLNIIWEHLETQKNRLLLILTLLGMTAIPAVINYKYSILPYWWSNLYPITYYFIGAYLKKYGPFLKKNICLLLLVICTILFGSLNFYLNYNIHFAFNNMVSWGSLQNCILVTLTFCYLLQINTQNVNKITQLLITKIAELSLTAYLVSYIFDQLYYPKLNSAITETPARLPYYIAIVPAVFISSLLLAQLIHWIYQLLAWFVNCLKK